jgi:iron complex outermembrane receptor protein
MNLVHTRPQRWMFAPLCTLFFAIPASLLSTTVLAQKSSVVLEEVIVNARRVSESAQDVPIAITAFTEQDIEILAPRTLRDFDGTIPNVFVSMNAAAAQGGAIFIRGIGYPGTEKTQSPGVGVIIDGVQLGSNTGQLMDTFDIERVEVNRGPQGVLFGKNTTGGTISIDRVAPKFNEWGFAFAGLYGDYDEQTFKGRVNIPLVDDKLALKVGYITRSRDGYWDNLTLDCTECEGDVDYQSFTAAVLWQPTDSLDLKLTYDRVEDDSDTAPMDAFYSGETPFITEADFDELMEYDVDALTLEVNWDSPIGTLTSITGYRDSTDLVRTDFDGVSLAAPVVPILQLHTNRDQDFEQFTQELRLSGSFTDNVDFTAGVYYYESEHDFFQNSATVIQIPNPVPPLPCTVLGLNPNPALGDEFCQIPESRDIHIATEDVTSLGVFGSVNWRPTEELELSFGARYIDEEKDFENAFFETSNPDNIIDGPSVNDDNSWDDVIIKATAAYRFNDQVMLYGSYAEGFLSGGYSIRATQPEFATYEPENVDSWELGLKSDLWNRRARLNLTAFYSEQTDKQFLSVFGAPPGQAFPTTNTLVNNLPDTEIQGLEVEFLVALTDNFSVNLIGGIQDGESKAYIAEGARIGQPPGPFQAAESEVAFFPEWNWAITPTYQAQLGRGRLVASATYKDQDEYIIGVNSLDFGDVYEPGYSRLDARLAYEFPMANEDLLVLSVFGKNLTDEEYREHQLDLAQPNSGFQGWGAPRTWAVEVQYRR